VDREPGDPNVPASNAAPKATVVKAGPRREGRTLTA
jgi:hypothetical protein